MSTSLVLLSAEIPELGYSATVTMVDHIVDKPYRVEYTPTYETSVSWHGSLDAAARAAIKWIARRYPTHE